MLLKGHKNQIPATAAATRRATGQVATVLCWHPTTVVSFGFTPSMPSNSLMLRDKGQQERLSAKTYVTGFECLVGGYLFNQHR